jgi:hypothetical protein
MGSVQESGIHVKTLKGVVWLTGSVPSTLKGEISGEAYRKKVEILFAHLKQILKLERLRLSGPSGARDEFLLAATAQNLRRMAKRLTPMREVAEGTRSEGC